LKNCAKALQQGLLGVRRLTYQPTQRMISGQTSDVEVVLSNGPVSSVQLPGSTPTTVVSVQTPCLVSAELTGASFTVSPPGPQPQSFATQSTLTWRWTVIPSRAGKSLELDLILHPVVLLDGIQTEGASSTFVKSITVTALKKSAPGRFLGFVFNPAIIAALLTGFLTIAGTIWLKRRDEKKASKPPATG
jgi:hypothetical protein